MSDYINVLIHTPLFLYHFINTAVGFIMSRPWPSGEQIFTSVALLVILYIPRLIIHLAMPEEKVAYIIQRKIRRKRSKFVPSASEHKAGASVVIDSMLHH